MSGTGHDVELPRGRLASLLYDATRDVVEYLFDNRMLGIVPLLRWLNLPLDAGIQRSANSLTLAALPSPLSASRVAAEG